MCGGGGTIDPLKELRDLATKTKEDIFGKPKASPDPEAERLKAEADAANAANTSLVSTALRKRKQLGRTEGDNVLATGDTASVKIKPVKPVDTILGSGGL